MTHHCSITSSRCLLLFLAAIAAMAAARKEPPATQPSDREARLANRRESRVSEEAANLFRTADTTFLVGDLGRAAELFQKVLTGYPNSDLTVRAHARLGDCSFEAKKYAEAATHYRRAAAAADSAANDDETAAGVRCDFMVGQSCLAGKLYTQAFSQFRRFIDRHPGHPLVNQAYQAIGDAHLAMEQYQQALKAYRMVGTVIGEKTAAHRRISPGQRLYLRVTDADVNVGETLRTVTATVRTTSGDVEVVELEPLGQRSPVFIATIPTALGAPRHSGDLKDIFSEATAAKLRAQLAEAEQMQQAGKQKAEDAFELERSTQKIVNPAGTEKKRAALVAESEQLMAKAKAMNAEACKTIDAAYAAFEKTLAAWAPEQSLAAVAGKRPTTAPTTVPTTMPAAEEGDVPKPVADPFQTAAARPLAGMDEDEPAVPAAATAGEADKRGMTENEILQMRLAVAKTPTNIDTIDARLSTLSVWGRLLQRQFQRLELSGGDRIEIEYYDEVGPNGPNPPDKAIRKDVVEVASDAIIDILTRDGQEPAQQVVLNSEIMLRVEDFDADVSDRPDTVTVVLAAVPIVDQRTAELREAVASAAAPTTQRATPGETSEATEQARAVPLVPEGAASIKVTLTETGTHTGIFQKVVPVTKEGLISDGGASLSLRNEKSRNGLCSLRMAYVDVKAIRHPDGWVLAKTVDCIADAGGEVAAVKYRQTPLDMEAKLRRAVAAGEIGKIYLDLGLARRGREFLASAQADCNEVAKAGDKSGLAEEALHHSWRIYFYAGLLDEAVAACQTLIARYPKSEYIGDAMFAMGQASLERGEKQIEQDVAAGGKPGINRDLTRAITEFEDLVKRFPTSPLAPESLFMIGRAKIAAGQTGLDVFERLAKQYPDSVLAAKGLTKVAEYYVSIGDHRRALEYFGRVLIDYPDSPNLGEVLLQKGICQYKLGLSSEALQTFYRVVEEQNATELAAKAQKHINFINQKRGGKDE
ncbi:MAG: tetratricopeptide repeat protein [Tepidisphaerales bacterium]